MSSKVAMAASVGVPPDDDTSRLLKQYRFGPIPKKGALSESAWSRRALSVRFAWASLLRTVTVKDLNRRNTIRAVRTYYRKVRESLLDVAVLRQRVLRQMPVNEGQEIVNNTGQ